MSQIAISLSTHEKERVHRASFHICCGNSKEQTLVPITSASYKAAVDEKMHCLTP
jgi:hypothetical protein